MRTLTAVFALAAVALTTTGCGLFGGLSVSDIEKDIEKNAPLQLQASSIGSGAGIGQTGASLPPSVSVACPKNAKVEDGSRFTCKASVTEFGTTNAPSAKTHDARVDVTIKGDKARWSLRVIS